MRGTHATQPASSATRRVEGTGWRRDAAEWWNDMSGRSPALTVRQIVDAELSTGWWRLPVVHLTANVLYVR